MDKSILKHGRLEAITSTTPQWSHSPEFMFHYHGKQVAKVSFEGSTVQVRIALTYAPWAYVSNDHGQFFARISRVENYIHGVDVIDTDNLQALYMEYSVNNRKPKDESNFAALLDNEIKHAYNQAKIFTNSVKITGIK